MNTKRRTLPLPKNCSECSLRVFGCSQVQELYDLKDKCLGVDEDDGFGCPLQMINAADVNDKLVSAIEDISRLKKKVVDFHNKEDLFELIDWFKELIDNGFDWFDLNHKYQTQKKLWNAAVEFVRSKKLEGEFNLWCNIWMDKNSYYIINNSGEVVPRDNHDSV